MADPINIVPGDPPAPDAPPWFAYGEQDENGIDLSLIRENLKLTPWERACRADDARHNALTLLEYGRRHREKAAARQVR